MSYLFSMMTGSSDIYSLLIPTTEKQEVLDKWNALKNASTNNLLLLKEHDKTDLDVERNEYIEDLILTMFYELDNSTSITPREIQTSHQVAHQSLIDQYQPVDHLLVMASD